MSELSTVDLSGVNIRELKSELARRIVLESIPTYALHAELARREALEKIERGAGGARVREFLAFAAEKLDFTVCQLTGPRRWQSLADARAVAMSVARSVLKLSLVETGAIFGDRDHSTVVHAENRVRDTPSLQAAAMDLLSGWQGLARKQAGLVAGRAS